MIYLKEPRTDTPENLKTAQRKRKTEDIKKV